MKLSFSLNELKLMHDAVCTFEEMVGDESPEDQQQYTKIRKKIKNTINHIENTIAVEAELLG